LPGPVFLSIPEDVLEEHVPVRPHIVSVSPPAGSPDPDVVARALFEAEQPLIMVGGQLRRFGGSEAVERLAERHGIALAYETGFPDRLGVAPGHPNNFGILMGVPALERSADTVLALGSRFLLEAHPRPEWFPAANFIAHVNADPIKLEETRCAHWAAAADPGAFARALDERLAAMALPDERLQRRRAWLASLRQPRDGSHLNPLSATYHRALAPLHDAMDRGWVVDESVMGIGQLTRTLTAADGRRYVGTTGASLGWATGAAVGVALASGEPVTCVLGDGALRFGALGLWTIREQNLPVTIVVIDNGGYGSTRFFERQYVGKLGPDARPQRPGYFGSDLRDTGSTVEGIIQGFGIPTTVVPLGGDGRGAIERAWATSSQGPNAVVLQMEFGE